MRRVFDDHQNSAPVFPLALHLVRCSLQRSTAYAPVPMSSPPRHFSEPLVQRTNASSVSPIAERATHPGLTGEEGGGYET
jgi:hypothetical protein